MRNIDNEIAVGIEIYSTEEIEGIGGVYKNSYKDFIVKEITRRGNILEIRDDYQSPSFSVDSNEKFTTFNLIKINKDTFEAVRTIAKALNIPTDKIFYSGLKDKCSISVQKISIKGDYYKELKKLKIRDLFFRSITPTKRPIKIGDNLGNNFTIVIRNIEEKKNLKDNVNALIKDLDSKGFPNYYGLQRFGTFRTNSHIVGRYLLENNYERAYNEFITTTYSSESPRIQKIRHDLKVDGDLEKAYEVFPKSMVFERNMIKYLMEHPEDYKGTFSTLPFDLYNLLINAFQSYIFNKLITLRVNNGISLIEPENGDVISILDDDKGDITQIKYIYGDHGGFYDEYLDKALKLNRAVIVLPIVGYNTNLDDFPLMKPLFKELIKQEEIDISIYNGEILRELEFKGTFRAMTIKPIGLKFNELTDDKAFPSKMSLKIEFSLPKGCYATMLLREIIK